ncbi:hypothetical protein QZH41_007194 [Actinostola sp. cb2023]|nr:hypothetical protein QZH41_007194 [Actinostola sp. cb2023]
MARRRTGSRQDFLYPDRSKTKKSSSLASLKDEDTNGPLALVPTGATEFISTKQVSSELMQKFMELEKARKDANGNSRALNSNMTSLSQSSSTVNQSLEGDGKALVSSYQSLSASLVRGNLRSKSARSYQNTKYGSVPAISQPRSQPSSPTLPRKNQDPENDDSTQKNSENVFSRLTSNLGQDSDPDV